MAQIRTNEKNAKLQRVRFSGPEADRITALAQKFQKPRAAIVRALCRADIDDEQIGEALRQDDVKRGQRKGWKAKTLGAAS